MAYVLVFVGGNPERRELLARTVVRVGRAPGCDVVVNEPGISGLALRFMLDDTGHVLGESLQSVGSVEVFREDGTRLAAPRRGERFNLGPGVHEVRVHNGHVLVVRVVNPDVSAGRPGRARGVTITAGRWTRNQVLQPTPEGEWRKVAALCALRTGALPGPAQSASGARARVLEDVQALKLPPQGANASKWLQRRLERARSELGLVNPTDEWHVPVIGDWVVRSQVIDEATYVELQRARDAARAQAAKEEGAQVEEEVT
ncbi:FHA domain-containing protein [Cellulomonas fimi]|uniref:FHA domain-containing protein n=1 Tax=Cellulomonas fimi TaxID=1708 RepID=UPI002358F27B|nr:FHA domain-containing protein [Cellulomonas fimi]